MLGTFAIVAEEHSTDRCVSAACCPSPGDPEPPLYCCGQRAAAALRRALQREGGLQSNRERAPLLILLNPTGRGMKKKKQLFSASTGTDCQCSSHSPARDGGTETCGIWV